MPIRINLLEEEQKAKLARKRDPIMLTVRLSVMGVLLVLAVSVLLFARERLLAAQLQGMRGEWDQSQPKFKQTEQKIKTLEAVVARTDLVKARMENRFLWAPQLEIYKDVIPSTVQITRFIGQREVSTPTPAAEGSKGAAPEPMEIVRVTLEGIAEGGRPELVVYDFLTQLKSSKKLAEQVEEIRLVSLTKGASVANRASENAAPESSNARFVIEIQYKQKSVKQA